MVPDSELPVWPFLPNWSSPVVERLDWMTDVLDSDTGVEQRAALRASPRRSFEALFTYTGVSRAFYQNYITNLLWSEVMFPLWHDQVLLESVAVGATRIDFDNRWREFSAGGMALLTWDDPRNFETVMIEAVDESGITLANPTVKAWGDVRLFPMRRGTVEPQAYTPLTSTTASHRARFNVQGANDFPASIDGLPSHAGAPIYDEAPNWGDKVDLDFTWMIDTQDMEIGLRAIVPRTQRSFAARNAKYHLHGREAQHRFRERMAWFQGQLRSAWLPSFHDDLTVVNAVPTYVKIFNVSACGLSYCGLPNDARKWLQLPTGQIIEMLSVAPVANPAYERITLRNWPSVPIDRNANLRFISKVRLASDTVEISHLTDSDGSATVSLIWREFDDLRSESLAGRYEPSAGVMSSGTCGEGTVPPFVPEGWDLTGFELWLGPHSYDLGAPIQHHIISGANGNNGGYIAGQYRTAYPQGTIASHLNTVGYWISADGVFWAQVAAYRRVVIED